MEKLVLSESCSSEEICYGTHINSDSSDEEEIRLPRKRNINRIISSDSDSEIDKFVSN